jgi:hypothetical protein
MTDTTVTNVAPIPQPQGNQSEARTPDGTLKDQGNTIPSAPPTETKPEGGSFLTQETKPEAKPEGETKPEGAPKEGDEPKPEAGAPEKYADFKLPDGYTLDPEAGKEVTGLFKELNLSQDQAQKLVDYYAKNSLQTAEAPYKMWADMQKEWVNEIHDRFGSKADATRRDINSAITNALPPSLAKAFRTAIDLTGAGSNPDIFEALSILAKPHLEGKSVPAGKPSGEANKAPGAPAAPSLAEAMYPHLAANRGT